MEDLKVTDLRELLVKKPFFEVTPKGYMKHDLFNREVTDKENPSMPEDTLYRRIKTQADFLREFYPSGHRIWDEEEYPDIYKQNPEDGKWYVQKIMRTAFAFQFLIWVKHVLHVTGNDIQFELTDSENDNSIENDLKLLSKFKKGWLTHNVEIRFFEAVCAYMKVAEGAIVGFFDKNKRFGMKTLSYDNGDILYPHYDSLTGEMAAFARKYYDYDDDGKEITEWVEVWDDRKFYRFKKGLGKGKLANTVVRIARIFGISDYTLVNEELHGFLFVPVAYKRNDDGPCWSQVQKNIEDYEEAYAYLCENNKAYAFPILSLTGDGESISVTGDNTGAAKTILITDPDGKAQFLNGTDASNAFATQLNKSYDLIYELSFTVKPPELKSGDLPGVALKLLYSPAIEMATNDAQKLQPFLDQIVRICKFGIGTEEDCMASMTGLSVNAWIEPYVHQNDTELVTNLATAVQNSFLSKQTASERNSKFSKNDEFTRIMREKKEEQQQDLLMDIERADNETENAIQQQKEAAKINQQSSGSDMNTGNGRKAGRPNKSGKEYDDNGNWDGRNNWQNYNRSH